MPTTSRPPTPWPARVGALRQLWWVYAALLALGLALYFAHDGSSTTPRFAAPDAPDASERHLRDLARLDAGATVTASSYDLGRNLHPLFLIDGDDAPRRELRWASAARDRAPWLLVHLPAPAELDAAVLTLARPLPKAVRLACLRGDAVVATPEVPRVTTRLRVPLGCKSADGLRVDLTPADAPKATVQASEIAILGRAGEAP